MTGRKEIRGEKRKGNLKASILRTQIQMSSIKCMQTEVICLYAMTMLYHLSFCKPWTILGSMGCILLDTENNLCRICWVQLAHVWFFEGFFICFPQEYCLVVVFFSFLIIFFLFYLYICVFLYFILQ